jgi:6-phosphogluconolactonase (cycloisomerase 2 family)
VRRIISAAIAVFLFGAFEAPVAAQSASPTYLFLLEGKGVPTGTIHGFSVNPSTGALSEVPGSPFSAGLGPAQIIVDPTNRFLYVTNQNSNDITGFSIDAGTGSLTLLPGSPFFIGAEPVTMGVDPTGRFLYVFAEMIIFGASQEVLFEYSMDSVSGALTPTTSSPVTWEPGPGILVTSIVFNATGNVAYLGQSTNNGRQGPILICSVDFTTGALTQVASAQPTSIEADELSMTPGGFFFFSTSRPNDEVDAFTISATGQLSEISGSPYAVGNVPAAILVHPSGNFLYVVNENQAYQANPNPSQYLGSVSAFGIGGSTGALTPVAGSPFSVGINAASIGVDPTGTFTYVASTNYVTGTYQGSAQIQGFSIDSSTGVLSPFASPAWTDSAQSTGSQLVVDGGARAVPNPAPMISSLTPSSALAAGPAFTLQINGTNFVPASRVYFAGQLRSTTFVSSTQLNASILAGDISNEGVAVVFVFNPLPGGGASISVEFTVASPAPTITSLSPTSIVAGTVVGGVSVIGSNFITSSIVNFNGAPLPTVLASPTVLRGQIPGSDIASVGTATITVTNPSNGGVGGGTSNALTLNIVAPPPKFAVTSIAPTTAQAGGSAFTLTVNGSAFVAPASGPPASPGSVISFGLVNEPTTFVSSTQLTAAIPASAIAISGNPYVIVTNPDGTTSTALTFAVNNPVPGGGAVSPPGLPVGSNALTLNVAGTGFLPDSVVYVNGNHRPTKYVSPTLLQVTLSSSDLAQGGTLNITVVNPSPGGGTSPAIHFAVEEDSLSLTSPSTSITAGQTATFTLSFSSSSGAISNPVDLTLTSITPHLVGAAASFKPATIPPGVSPEAVVLSIRTQPRTSASAIRPLHGPPAGWPRIWLLLLAAVAAGIWFRELRGRVSLLAPQVLLAVALCAFASLMACAGGPGTSSTSHSNPPTGTQPGTYTIVVTATSAGVAHNIPVTLTVM